MFRKAFLAASLFAASALAPIADAQILLGAGHPISAGGGGGIGTPVKLGSLATTGGSTGADYVLTTTANSPAGALTICGISWQLGGSDTFITAASDSAGNTYTVETFTHSASFQSNVQWIWKANAAALGSGGTITASVNVGGSAGYRGMACYSVTGIATASPRDVFVTQVSASGNPSIASGTFAQAAEIVFGGTQPFAGANYADTAPFTTLDNLSAAVNRFGIGYKIVSSTASVTYAPTIDTGQFAASVISFKGP